MAAVIAFNPETRTLSLPIHVFCPSYIRKRMMLRALFGERRRLLEENPFIPPAAASSPANS